MENYIGVLAIKKHLIIIARNKHKISDIFISILFIHIFGIVYLNYCFKSANKSRMEVPY